MRIRLAVIGKTAVYLHLGTMLCAGYMLLIRRGMLLAVGMGSILLHECAHGAMAWLLGHPPCEMEILPMGAMMRLDGDEGIPPWQRLLILLAGPGMTLLLCCGSMAAVRWGVCPLQTGAALMTGNLALLLLNLLPAMPLDGGNLLMLLLGQCFSDRVARRMMQGLSTLVGMACIVGNLYLTWRNGGWNLSLSCAGCFMVYAGTVATRTNALHELRGFLDRKIRLERRDVLNVCSRVVTTRLTLRRAVMLLHPRRYTHYWIMTESMRPVGMLTESRLIEAYLRTPGACISETWSAIRAESQDVQSECPNVMNPIH